MFILKDGIQLIIKQDERTLFLRKKHWNYMDLSIEKNKRLDSYTNGNINYRFEYDKCGIESSLFINDNLYMNFIYDKSTVIFCINKLSVEDCCKKFNE